MENKKLLEEIKKFKKLAGIITEAVITTPTQWVGSIISKMAAYTLDNAEVVRLTRALRNKIEISTSKLITRIDWDNLTEAELDELFINQRILIAFKEALDNEGSDVMLDTAIDFYPDALKKAAIAYRKKVTPLRPYSPPQQPVPGGNDVNNPTVSQLIGGQTNISQDVLTYLQTLKERGQKRDNLINAVHQLTKKPKVLIEKKLDEIIALQSGEGYENALQIGKKITDDVTDAINKKEWYQFWLKEIKPSQPGMRSLNWKEWITRLVYLFVAVGYLTESYNQGSLTRGEGLSGILKNFASGNWRLLTGNDLENLWKQTSKTNQKSETNITNPGGDEYEVIIDPATGAPQKVKKN